MTTGSHATARVADLEEHNSRSEFLARKQRELQVGAITQYLPGPAVSGTRTMKPTHLDYVTTDGHERRLMVVTRHGRWAIGEPVPATVEDVIAVVRGLGKRDAARVRKELEKT